MMRYLLFFFSLALLASCGEPAKEAAKKNGLDPIGGWHSHTSWENNDITLTVRPDSTMLFKCIKSFCPGNKYFVAIGKWHIEHDSILVMQKITGHKYEVRNLFPELTGPAADTLNVIALDIEAKFLMDADHLYDIEPNGKRSAARYYDRKK